MEPLAADVAGEAEALDPVPTELGDPPDSGEPTAEVRLDGITVWAPDETLGAATHIGRTHARNEDAVVVRVAERDGQPLTIAVVCDGISTASHGEMAAQLAAEATAEVLLSAATGNGAFPADQRQHLVRTAIHLAHEAVCRAGIAAEEGKDAPGTTLVAALVLGDRVDVGWVGDSRAYLFSAPTPDAPVAVALQLTRDHSWVNMVVDSGELSEEQAEAAPLAHAITRCVGPLCDPEPARPAEPALSHAVAPPGSRLLLCTDGLSNSAPSPADMAALVDDAAQTAGTAAELCLALVRRGLELGGDDDVTVAVASLR